MFTFTRRNIRCMLGHTHRPTRNRFLNVNPLFIFITYYSMRKQNLFGRLMLCMSLIVMVCLASCSDTPKYARVISKDAALVVRVDVKQIAEKAQTADSKQLADKLTAQLAAQGLPVETQEKLKKIFEDPAEAGIDLRKPVFIFVENFEPKAVGMVAAVHDADKLAELVNTMAKQENGVQLVKEDGLNILKAGGAMTLMFDDDILLCMENEAAGDVMAEGKRRMLAKDDQGILERDDFKQLCKAKTDMQLLVSGKLMKQLENEPSFRRMAMWQQLYPAGLKLEDYSLLAELNTEKGEVALSVQSLPQTDEAKELIEKNAKMLGKVDGELLDFVPASALCVFNCNLNGKELSKVVMPSLRQTGALNEEQLEMAENLLSSIDGDVLLAVNAFDVQAGPQSCFLVKVSDKKKVKETITQLGGALLNEVEPGQYSVNNQFYLGVKNDIFYVSMPTPVLSMAKPQPAVEKDNFKGKLFFGSINVKNALSNPQTMAMMSGDSDFREALPFLQLCDRLEFSVEDATKAEMRLKLTQTDKNPLQLMLEKL